MSTCQDGKGDELSKKAQKLNVIFTISWFYHLG